MKAKLLHIAAIFLLILSNKSTQAQAPTISYATSSQTFTIGTGIGTWSPTLGGGTVPSSPAYANVTTVATGLNTPTDLKPDGLGNLFVTDQGSYTIKKVVISSGVKTIVAGNGTVTEANNTTGTSASFYYPNSLVYDGSANFYIADYGNATKNTSVRKMSSTSTYGVSSPAGNFSGSPLLETDGTGTGASFSNMYGITYDGTNLYVVDNPSGKIRKVTTGGVVTTIATAINGKMVAYDGAGNLYITDDSYNIQKVNIATGTVTAFAGTGTAAETDGTGSGASFNLPVGIVYDNLTKCLYIADRSGHTVRRITVPGGVVTTLAGSSAVTGTTNGVGTAASFTQPNGITSDNAGSLYLTDQSTNNIRKINLIGYSVSPALPAGLSLNTATGVITGTPIEASSSATYTVTATNSTGSNSTTITIQVNTITPSSIYYSSSTMITQVGTAISPNPWTPINTGCTSSLVYSITPTLPAGLSFNTATGGISGTPTASSPSTTYTVTATCTSGSSSTTITIAVGKVYDWISGSASDLFGTTAWNTAGNWSPSGVPGPADVARIGENAGVLNIYTNQPTISTNATVGSLQLGHGGILGGLLPPVITIAASSSLTINNSLTVDNTGLLALFSATITGGGSGSTTGKLNMAPGSIVNITSTASLTLTSPLSFTLQSNATADAAIGQISTGAITGTAVNSINVQRYLSSTRGYRLLSSPVNTGTSTTSGTNTFNRYSINYLKDSTYIQGTNSAGGFNRTGNPTIYIYRESIVPLFTAFTNSDFRGINNITASPTYTLDIDGGGYSIPVTNGYLFYFIGGFTTATPWIPGSGAASATLTTSGTLNTGQITSTHWYTPGHTGLSYTASSAPTAEPGTNLIGNPYPSAINWDTFQTATLTSGIYGVNVDNTIWVLNPITQNYGSYIANTGGVGSASFVSNIISSGQAFFVHANATGAQLTFNESAKPTINSSIPVSETVLSIPKGGVAQNSLMDMPANAANRSLAATIPAAGNITPPQQYLRLAMGQNNVNIDETLVRFNNQASCAYNRSIDALYKTGYGLVNLATISNDQKVLSINSIPLPGMKSDTVKLAAYANLDGIYQLTLTTLVNIPPLYDIWLKDAYKNDSLDIKHNPTYSFNIYKADTNSFGSKRFSLIIRQNPAFAYHLVNFTANRVISTSHVLVSWQTANEGEFMNFIVEHSTDGGKTFNPLGTMQSTNAGAYSLTDNNPVNGLNMYRMQQVDMNNTVTYSQVVSVQIFNLNNANNDVIVVYPNPGKDVVNLIINSPTKPTTYDIKFITSWGTIKEEFTSSLPVWNGSIANLDEGIYIIQVSDGSTLNLLGEAKYIKQ